MKDKSKHIGVTRHTLFSHHLLKDSGIGIGTDGVERNSIKNDDVAVLLANQT